MMSPCLVVRQTLWTVQDYFELKCFPAVNLSHHVEMLEQQRNKTNCLLERLKPVTKGSQNDTDINVLIFVIYWPLLSLFIRFTFNCNAIFLFNIDILGFVFFLQENGEMVAIKKFKDSEGRAIMVNTFFKEQIYMSSAIAHSYYQTIRRFILQFMVIGCDKLRNITFIYQPNTTTLCSL